MATVKQLEKKIADLESKVTKLGVFIMNTLIDLFKQSDSDVDLDEFKTVASLLDIPEDKLNIDPPTPHLGEKKKEKDDETLKTFYS